MYEVVRLTQDLIRFKTMHGNGDEIRRCAAYIQTYFETHGIAFTRSDHNGYPTLRVMPADDTAKVLLMGHIDVVDATDDVFEPVVKDGNLYGRGAIDDKYAAALSMVLAKTHIDRLRHRGMTQADLAFGILITSDEEIGGYDGVARHRGVCYGALSAGEVIDSAVSNTRGLTVARGASVRVDGLVSSNCVYGLYCHGRSGSTIQGVVADERRADGDTLEPRGCRFDSRNVDHSASAARRSILAAQMKSLSESPSMACVV